MDSRCPDTHITDTNTYLLVDTNQYSSNLITLDDIMILSQIRLISFDLIHVLMRINFMSSLFVDFYSGLQKWQIGIGQCYVDVGKVLSSHGAKTTLDIASRNLSSPASLMLFSQ